MAEPASEGVTPDGQGMFGGIVQHAMMNTEAGPVPAFVVNGLAYGVTNTEVTVMLLFSNQPNAALILAPAMAKTLGESLVRIVGEYEQSTGQTVRALPGA
jgi:hypothetical protein